uniref:hypothetical protein n=1 Tax=Candidatus Cryptobacteroides bacterium TaxID=3085639 RepID=UPI004025D366
MNEIEKVLSFFKTAEDWNSFVELSNMKDMMVRELKGRLLTEMRIIAESKLSGVGWEYDAKDDYISIVLQKHQSLSIRIEWRHWSWYKRGAGIWINPSKIAPEDFIGNVNANADLKGFLTANGFHESRENAWYPFVKTIPAKVFFQDDSSDSCSLEEECLFRAKQDAKGLADDLWEEVFKPFVEKEDAISMLVEALQ